MRALNRPRALKVQSAPIGNIGELATPTNLPTANFRITIFDRVDSERCSGANEVCERRTCVVWRFARIAFYGNSTSPKSKKSENPIKPPKNPKNLAWFGNLLVVPMLCREAAGPWGCCGGSERGETTEFKVDEVC